VRCWDNRANRFTSSHHRLTSHLPIILFHKHHIYPLMPSPAHLLPLTGSTHRAVHGEHGFNRWKKIWVFPSVPVNSQPWTAPCGDHYDPQPVQHRRAAVSEW